MFFWIILLVSVQEKKCEVSMLFCSSGVLGEAFSVRITRIPVWGVPRSAAAARGQVAGDFQKFQ